MNNPRFRISLGLLHAFALACAPSGLADIDHAADDEFAAAAAALAPQFDPERDAITIERVMAQRDASTGKGPGKKGQRKNRRPAGANAVTRNLQPLATGPEARGAWGSVIAWAPHIPVTASLLPNGRLLTFASNERTTFPSGPEFTYAAVWDPATGQFNEVNNNRHDMFCGGTSLLPDGRLVVNGGRATTRLSSIFNWQSNQWNVLPNMNDPRWYNTSLALPDGGVFTVSGRGAANTAELWNEASGWRRLSGVGWSAVTSQPGYINIWHPFLMLAPNGSLFHFGPTSRMNWVTTSGTGSLTFSGSTVPGTHYPKEGVWAMYDEGCIMVAGGGANTTSGTDSTTGTSTTASYKVDLRGSSPVVTSIAPMMLARQFANSVVLPNGEVMVIGGNGGRKFSDQASVLTPEIWSPRSGAWRAAANHAVPRNYHSVALLLPDGRVWAGGGGLSGNAADHRDAEIFTPPTLYTAAGALASRPVISSMPAKVGVGTRFNVNATPGLSRFTMIRISAVTHSVNTDQRFLEASFRETSPGVYQIDAHRNVNVLLPGYWMLFGLNASGVHSVSKIFQVDPVFSVALANPGNRTGFTGEAVSLDLTSEAPAGASLAFSATGLPPGLSIHAATGVISGTPSAAGSFNVTVSATDGITTANQSFNWTLAPVIRSHQFDSFPSAAGLTLNGHASVTSSRLRLTPAVANQNGSAWLSQSFPVRANTSFATRFVFRQSGAADGGDGFAFVVQGNSATTLGTGGGSLGYGGINASLAVEFDSFTGSNDPNANHVAVLSNGVVTHHLATHTPSFDLEDGLDHTAWVEYDGVTNTLRIYLSEAVTRTRPATPVITLGALDLTGLVGQQAWFGFTAAAGGSFNAHEILAWDMAMDANKLPGLSLPPLVTNPGPRTSVMGSAVALQVVATDPESDPLTFTASNLPPGLSINAGGLVSGIPTAAGTRTVTVGASDGVNPVVSVSFQWSVNAPFELAPLAAAAIGSGVSKGFTATSTGGNNVRFKWSFGDGTPETSFSSSPNVSHAFANPGRYLVTLTATDDTGRTQTSSFHQGVSAPLTAKAPAASSSITVERRISGNHRVWVVNPDADTVAVLDAVTRGKLAEIPVAASPRTLAVAPDGRVWISCAKGGAVSIVSPATLSVVQTLTLPRGSRPFGIAFDPGGTAAWLTLEATGRLLKLDPVTGAILADTAVGSDPRHLSVSHDGARVLVSRFITPLLPGESTASIDTSGRGGEIVVVNGSSAAVARTVILRHSEAQDTSISARGIPNYLGAPVITPDGLSAWIPSKQDNIKRGLLRDGRSLTHDSAVRAIASRVDLTGWTEDHPARIDFNDAGMPTAVCHDPSGILSFVALEGSRAVAVVDTWNHDEITRFDARHAPQGLALSADGNTLFVQNFMDRSVTVHDVSGLRNGGVNPPVLLGHVSTVAVEPLAAKVLLGKRHFYDTKDNRLALQEYISCASCHDDAGHDGRVWDFTGFGEGLRNTIDLRGRGGNDHGPLHWSGNFDEIQDFEGQIRAFAGGTGLIAGGSPHPPLGTPNGGRSADLDALAAYLGSLDEFAPGPGRTSSGGMTNAALRGRAVFIAANCASCHSGGNFSDSGSGPRHDIGTLKSASGKRLNGVLEGIDAPTLRGLSNGAPFLHDGSALTLGDAVMAHAGVTLSGSDLADLVSYLVQIDDSEPVAPAPTPPSVTAFTAAPPSIASGESATLTWNIADGGSPLRSLSLNGVPVTGSSATVRPTATTTYELAVTNAVATTRATVTVTVAARPVGPSYAAWAAAFGASGNIAADGDGDSYPEGLEYALGLHPGSGSVDLSTVPGANPAIARAVRMERSVTTAGDRRYDLVFTRPKAAPSSASYWLERSGDLENWSIIANLNGSGATDAADVLDIIVTDLGDGTEEVRAGLRFFETSYLRLLLFLPGGEVRSAPFGWVKRPLHREYNLIAPPFAREARFGGNFTDAAGGVVDAAASWTSDQWAGFEAQIVSGPAAGLMVEITGNTSNRLAFGKASAPVLQRLAAAGSGTYVIRRAHTLGSLFGEHNEMVLLPGEPAGGDIVSFLNPDSSFADYYFRSSGPGGRGWRGVADPIVDESSRKLPVGEGFFLFRPVDIYADLFFHGEVILGRRVAPVRSGISMPGMWTPIDNGTLATAGLEPFFLVSPNGYNDSNLYLEMNFGGLYGHYLKDGSKPGGTGWRWVFDDFLDQGGRTFDPGTCWLLFRFGEEGLWTREQPFRYKP
jgi:YVTN family beta-propeller protein